MHVYILTRCKRMDRYFGTSLIFKTLRVGFPTFPVHVVDNASLPEARSLLRKGAQSIGASFQQLARDIPHSMFLTQVLARQKEGGAIFLDPDMCFWETVEEWRPNGLVAGRLIPSHHDPVSRSVAYPRLHTSFLWIPSVVSLRSEVQAITGHRFDFSPFQPLTFRTERGWERFDTGSTLYNALPDQMQAFTERELDSYDHLFCGTHQLDVAGLLDAEYSRVMQDLYDATAADHRALKGAWRRQEEFFGSLASAVAIADGELADANAGPSAARGAMRSTTDQVRQRDRTMEPDSERACDDTISVVVTEIGLDAIRVEAEGPVTNTERLPKILDHALHDWLRNHPTRRVRTVLPITSQGNTVAIHVWYDEKL